MSYLGRLLFISWQNRNLLMFFFPLSPMCLTDLYPCIKDPATHTKSRGLMSLPLTCSASKPLTRRAKGPSPMFTRSPPHDLLLPRSEVLFTSFRCCYFLDFLGLCLCPSSLSLCSIRSYLLQTFVAAIHKHKGSMLSFQHTFGWLVFDQELGTSESQQLASPGGSSLCSDLD